MEMVFVGHSGFLLRHGAVGLLTDPWLFGSAFDDGWDLLVPSVLSNDDMARVTHIYISHEHPDHFHLGSLRKIRAETSSPITVLFQRTRDRKLLQWCRDQGFEVIELPEKSWVDLGGLRVLMGRVGIAETWLCAEADGTKVLNLNDCVFDRSALASIAALTGSVDALVAQFSYASWQGNPEDVGFRAKGASGRLRGLVPMIEELRVKAVVPAASFSWFSHVDNAYLNDLRTDVPRVVELIAENGAQPVVLAPGDRWEVGAGHDNDPAMRHYSEAWDVSGRQLHTSESVELDELRRLGDDYVKRLKQKNNRLVLWAMARSPRRRLRPVTLRLVDLSETVRFDPLGGVERVEDPAPEVELHSECLAFVLRFEWGFDTLYVNGRFRSRDVPPPWTTAFMIPGLNNAGERIGLTTFGRWLAHRVRSLVRPRTPASTSFGLFSPYTYEPRI